MFIEFRKTDKIQWTIQLKTYIAHKMIIYCKTGEPIIAKLRVPINMV